MLCGGKKWTRLGHVNIIFKIKNEMPQLREYQMDDEKKTEELIKKVFHKLKMTRAIIQPEFIKEFVEQNYDLLVTDIDTISPDILLKNYMDFFKDSSIFESISRLIKETEIYLESSKKKSI